MGSTAGNLVARALKREGVEVLFTLCGGHIMSIYDGCIDEGIRVVDVRHEQSAAFAADAWSRLTGKVGVCAVTAGPGATNAVTAIANAWRAGSPLVVLGGQGPVALAGKGSLQEMDVLGVMTPITKWRARVTEARRLPEFVAEAFRQAASGVPGPVYLELPLDVLFAPGDTADPFPAPFTGRPGLPGDPSRVAHAAALLHEAERPVVLIGSQIRWSPEWVSAQAFAAAVGAPVYVSGMARGLLPDSPFARSRKNALRKADVVLVLGTPLDFRLSYGDWNETARMIQVDLDPAILGHNRSADIAIWGDSGSVMRQLLAAGDLGGGSSARQAWLVELRAVEEKKAAEMAPALSAPGTPVHPLRLCAEIDAALPPEAIVIGDGGDFVATAAAVLRPRRYPAGWMDPGPLGTLGVGMGFAMAARLAYPQAPVLLLLGDGTAGLNLMELEAAARQKLPFVVVIGNDAAWSQIRRGQIDFFTAARAVATGLEFTRYEQAAIGLGCHGEYVESPEEVGPALARAFAADRPTVINVKLGASDFRAGAISV